MNISSREHRFQVADYEVVLSPPLPDQDIADSEWLVFNARGFATESEAKEYGHKLRAALEVSSVATRLGVDAGRDLATAGLGEHVRQRIAEETGTLVRDNVHGLDVFVDDPNVRILHFSATGTVRANPEPLLSDLDALHDIAANASPRTNDVPTPCEGPLTLPTPTPRSA